MLSLLAFLPLGYHGIRNGELSFLPFSKGRILGGEVVMQLTNMDITASGTPTKQYFAAVGAVTTLVRGFSIDLITPDTSIISDALRDAIERGGNMKASP